MLNLGLKRQQKSFVFRIIFRSLDIIACEFPDCIIRFPKRDQKKMRPPALEATQNVDAAVARSGAVIADSSSSQILEILVGVCSIGHPPPNSRDHGFFPRSLLNFLFASILPAKSCTPFGLIPIPKEVSRCSSHWRF